jgi:hypothetical protein
VKIRSSLSGSRQAVSARPALRQTLRKEQPGAQAAPDQDAVAADPDQGRIRQAFHGRKHRKFDEYSRQLRSDQRLEARIVKGAGRGHVPDGFVQGAMPADRTYAAPE